MHTSYLKWEHKLDGEGEAGRNVNKKKSCEEFIVLEYNIDTEVAKGENITCSAVVKMSSLSIFFVLEWHFYYKKTIITD